MVAHIYDQLGMTYRMLPPEVLSGENVYDVEFVHDMSLVEMQVDNAGTDFAQELEQMIVDFYKNGIEVVKVCLNMSNPSAAKAYELFAANGFFFAGVLPGCESGEYLLLLHLMGLPMEWDKVVSHRGLPGAAGLCEGTRGRITGNRFPSDDKITGTEKKGQILDVSDLPLLYVSVSDFLRSGVPTLWP